MDGQDGPPGTPDWRPASSLSSNAPSIAASSGIISLHPSTATYNDKDTLAAASSSEHSTAAAERKQERSEAFRDLAPFEAMACELLTTEIREHASDATQVNGQAFRPPTFRADSLEDAILNATSAIRSNAKWFAPAAFADLILTVLDASFASSSSAVLFAAIELVDSVCIYSVLPTRCLFPVIRYLAYTYHQGHRANRHKKLSERAWSVAERIKQSHVGRHLVDSLLEIIRADLTLLDAKTGFATTAGALMLVSEQLLGSSHHETSVDSVDLLLSLEEAVKINDAVINEQIMVLLTQLISNENLRADLDRIGCWDAVMQIAIRCVARSSTDLTSQAMVKALETLVLKFEPRHLPNIVQFFAETNLPLSPLFQSQMATTWQGTLLQLQGSPTFDALLRKLCTSTNNIGELTLVVRKSMELLMALDEPEDLKEILRSYQSAMRDPTTIATAIAVIGKELVTSFQRCTDTNGLDWMRTLFFEALCDMSHCSADIARFLFRLRADITGKMYFQPGDRASTFDSQYDAGDLPIREWLKVLPSVLEHGAQNWETHQCFIANLNALLSNHQMFTFTEEIDIVKALRAAICERMVPGNTPEPLIGATMSKSSVIIHYVQILTTILSYRRHLTKQEGISIISVFNNTAGSGDTALSIQCIHALTICCYEVPQVTSSYMDDIIDKMSRLVTQRSLAIHVLQFLAGLSRLPNLYQNFLQHDYKKIFGVCYSYLHFTRSVETDPQQRLQTPASDHSSTTRSEETLPEYVYALAHHVIVFWYIALKTQDREALKPYITKCLTYTDVDGNPKIEEQGMVTLDLVDRLDAAARSGSMAWHGDSPFHASDGQLFETSRLAGLLVITTATSLRSAKTLVTVRRASGTSQMLICPGDQQDLYAAVDGTEQDYITVYPNDFDGRTYGKIFIPPIMSHLGALQTIQLPDHDSVKRGIASIDRMSGLDSHKAGVIYIGEAQDSATDILHNISGSPDYKEFLEGLGTLQALQGARFNSQGLDRANNTDGHHTIVWNNDVTEMVFHVTTMMPNSGDLDETVVRKKSHLGNDHVNIIFNNYGAHFTFEQLYNIFPSAFAYVYIVITPSARTSFMEARTANATTAKADRFYNVEALTKPDYPNVSPAAEVKVVSGASLPGLVRNLAFNDCIVSMTKSPGSGTGEYPSSWRYRLQQIQQLRSRYESKWA